ncbi:MAG TPA: YlxR family protein [Anaeromyxobacteraceae bacterium]|jgi:predicted RNA-binding protein YlxR (DUF448 family)|nr:YlxR family protein [Anaeromyxobacteraceae bacterium]
MSEPIRTCVGCGTPAPQRELVRLRVVEERVEVDLRRSGGRGAWLHADRACLARAEKRRAFGRAFRRAGVVAPPELRRDVLTGTPRKD